MRVKRAQYSSSHWIEWEHSLRALHKAGVPSLGVGLGIVYCVFVLCSNLRYLTVCENVFPLEGKNVYLFCLHLSIYLHIFLSFFISWYLSICPFSVSFSVSCQLARMQFVCSLLFSIHLSFYLSNWILTLLRFFAKYYFWNTNRLIRLSSSMEPIQNK